MKNREELFQYFSKRLDEIIEREDFFKYYFGAEMFATNFDESIDGMVFFTGLSRFAIVDDYENDFMIKIPLNDNYEKYCAREVEIYESAQAEHLEKFFARPIYLGRYERTVKFFSVADVTEVWDCPDNGWDDEYVSFGYFDECMKLIEDGETVEYKISLPLYAYEKVEGFDNFYVPEYDEDEDVENYLNDVINRSYSPLSESDKWISKVIIFNYGDDIYEKLSTFLDDENVNDLHTSNCAYTEEQGLKLADYAGYGNL